MKNTTKLTKTAAATMAAVRNTKRNEWLFQNFGFDTSKLLTAEQRSIVVAKIRSICGSDQNLTMEYYKDLRKAFKVRRFGLLKSKDFDEIVEYINNKAAEDNYKAELEKAAAQTRPNKFKAAKAKEETAKAKKATKKTAVKKTAAKPKTAKTAKKAAAPEAKKPADILLRVSKANSDGTFQVSDGTGKVVFDSIQAASPEDKKMLSQVAAPETNQAGSISEIFDCFKNEPETIAAPVSMEEKTALESMAAPETIAVPVSMEENHAAAVFNKCVEIDENAKSQIYSLIENLSETERKSFQYLEKKQGYDFFNLHTVLAAQKQEEKAAPEAKPEQDKAARQEAAGIKAAIEEGAAKRLGVKEAARPGFRDWFNSHVSIVSLG